MGAEDEIVPTPEEEQIESKAVLRSLEKPWIKRQLMQKLAPIDKGYRVHPNGTGVRKRNDPRIRIGKFKKEN